MRRRQPHLIGGEGRVLTGGRGVALTGAGLRAVLLFLGSLSTERTSPPFSQFFVCTFRFCPLFTFTFFINWTQEVEPEQNGFTDRYSAGLF